MLKTIIIQSQIILRNINKYFMLKKSYLQIINIKLLLLFKVK